MKPFFPTRQNPGIEGDHTPLHTRTLDELQELEKLEQLNRLADIYYRNQFLSNFGWTNSSLEPEVNQGVEALLVDFHDIFARHCYEIGINTVGSATHTSR